MRNLVLIIILLISFISNSQTSGLQAVYSYSDGYITRTEVLIANENTAFYQVINKSLLEKRDSKLEIENDQYTITNLSNSTFSNFIFLENNSNVNYTYLKNEKRELIVRDSMPILQWKITNEEKLIDSYKCIKAEVDFRGRKFIVWYTPEIAVPFGPFKFKGLPGLILSVESSYFGSKLYWNLTSFKFEKTLPIPKRNDFQGEEMSLKELIIGEAVYDEEQNKRILSKMNRDIRQTKLTVKRLGAERIYEWEIE